MATILDSTSCINNCMDALIDRLDNRLLVQESDSARVGLLREGRLQADPTVKKVNILIHGSAEEWPDVLDTQGFSNGYGVDTTYSTGGGSAVSNWRRRFQIEFQIFLGNKPKRDGRSTANVVVSRVQNAIYTWNMGSAVDVDSFGEHAYNVQICKVYLDEGGGQGAYNWRGIMHVEFLTEIEPDDEKN